MVGQGWDEEIMVAVAMVGLEDLAGHFLPDGGHGARVGGRGWWWVRGG